jgi:23S rRNA pseudouridine1911/1915/1917 synthase
MADLTLIELLHRVYPDTPRTRLKKWIDMGRIRVEGEVVRQANRPILNPQAKIQLLGQEELAQWFRPKWAIHPKLSLLYMDTSVAAVDKGPGLLAVPAAGQSMSAMSIFGGFLASGKGDKRLPSSFRVLRPQPVHRLDQYTSGVLCFAMNPNARAHLIEQFSKHTARRSYIAYVDGKAKKPHGTWRHLLRFDEDKLRQRVVGTGTDKPRREGTVLAVTHYEVLEEYPTPDGMVSKLRLELETGRTHQIRVQAAEERLPLIGDRNYHPLYRAAKKEQIHLPILFDRQALHAASLELEHPDHAGKKIIWNAPLPEDLQELEYRLHQIRRTRHPSARERK